jgi:hypothetical protein
MTTLDRTIIQENLNQVKNNPKDPDRWERLGDLLAEAGENKRALFCYQQVLKLKPEDLEVRVNIERLQGFNSNDDEQDFDLKLLINPISWTENKIPIWFQVSIGLISFLITLILASLQEWKVTDLVWSLWITSLTLGYGYLITGIVSGAIRNGIYNEESAIKKLANLLSLGEKFQWMLVILGAVFMLVFFTIHFGMFHFVHSVFLNGFFPLVVMPPSTVFPNILVIIQISLTRYWPVIMLSAATQLRNFQNVSTLENRNYISIPYKNVVKMHLSIFVFAGLSLSGVSDLVLPYLLILYFFPFEAVWKYFKELKNKKMKT